MTAMPFITNTISRRIQWGECDPAGIVFYPRYFEMFDASTTAMFSAALGLTKYQMFETYKFAGYPMVDTRARFLAPSRFGDRVVVESSISQWRRSSFDSAAQVVQRRCSGRRMLGNARVGNVLKDATRNDRESAGSARGNRQIRAPLRPRQFEIQLVDNA